jgi:transcriptional regulator with XRE-family HTH domain
MKRASEKLLAWRLAGGLSQRQAAERADISQAAWCEYESGNGSTPKVDQAIRIAALTKGHVAVEDWATPTLVRAERKRRVQERRDKSSALKKRRRPKSAAA